jgi:hypothetical protein
MASHANTPKFNLHWPKIKQQQQLQQQQQTTTIAITTTNNNTKQQQQQTTNKNNNNNNSNNNNNNNNNTQTFNGTSVLHLHVLCSQFSVHLDFNSCFSSLFI